MKNLFSFKCLLSMLLLFVGMNAWGQETVTLAYSTETTTNMTGNNDAATLGLDAASWSVIASKGKSSNYPGLNKSKYIALYYNANGSNTITVSNTVGGTINSIVITYTGSSYSNGTISVGGNSVTATSTTETTASYNIESSSFVIGNGNTSNVQVRISSITIKYTKAATGKTETKTSFPVTEYTAYIGGEAFTAPTATVTGGENLAPAYSSDNTAVATVNASTGAVTLVAPGTAKITASYAGDDTYEASSASYTLTVGKVYASLADLVAGGKPTSDGYPVKVTLTNETITSIYTTSKGYRNGIYLTSGGQTVQIYCQNVPDTWVANGTVSGTIEGTWKLYSSTWEVVISDWNALTYTVPTKSNPTITATYKTTLDVDGVADSYTVSGSDGDLSVVSSAATVATASVDNTAKTVTVTPVGVGTTKITITSAETDTYNEGTLSYTLTVKGIAKVPFAFNGGKADVASTVGMSQSGLGSDYSASPKLKFDGTGDNLVINYASSAKYLYYTVKGNSFSGGTFDVQESADGETYTTINSYTELSYENAKYNLKSDSRFIKFIYTNKDKGNVALGAIQITNEAGTAVDVTTAEYATFYNTYNAYTMPEGLTGYIFNKSSNKIVETYAAGSVVPAGEALVLNGTEGTYTLSYASNSATAASANALLGTDEDTALTADDNYYFYGLSLDNEGANVGFYWMNATGAAFTNGAHKAYLKLAKDSGAKPAYIFNDEANSINAVESTIDKNAPAYNIAGQRVAPTTKGILIQDGHKYIVK